MVETHLCKRTAANMYQAFNILYSGYVGTAEASRRTSGSIWTHACLYARALFFFALHKRACRAGRREASTPRPACAAALVIPWGSQYFLVILFRCLFRRRNVMSCGICFLGTTVCSSAAACYVRPRRQRKRWTMRDWWVSAPPFFGLHMGPSPLLTTHRIASSSTTHKIVSGFQIRK